MLMLCYASWMVSAEKIVHTIRILSVTDLISSDNVRLVYSNIVKKYCNCNFTDVSKRPTYSQKSPKTHINVYILSVTDLCVGERY